MKKQIYRFASVLLIVLSVISLFSFSVTSAVTYTNKKGSIKVVCGKYKKTFKAKKYSKNFCKALNKALDVARKKAKSTKKAKVTISKGNYKLDRTIKIYSNTTLKAKNCRFKYYGNLLRNGYNKKKSSASGYKGASNITIDGGTWDAAVPYSQAGTSNWRIQHSTFRFAHCKNIYIKNCTFKNNYNCHDIEFGGVQKGKIYKCKFNNDKGVNVFKNDGGRESIQLDVNTSEAMPEFKKYDNTTCKDITLSYCSFKNKFRAIGSHHAVLGNTYNNINVHHNTFKNIGGITVYGVYWTNSKIYSNTFDSVGLGVDIRSMTIGSGYNFYNNKKLSYKSCENAVKNSKLYIYDNKITVRKKNNTYVRPTGIRVLGEHYAAKDSKTGVNAGTYYVYNVNIGVNDKNASKPNTVSGNLAAGIQLNNAVNSLVKNNSVNASNSVYDSSNGVEVKGCENTVVESNTIKNGKQKNARGVWITNTAAGIKNNNITVRNNNISSFLDCGIYSYNTFNSKIEKNTIDSCDNTGLVVRASENNIVDSNTIKNTNNDSVYVYAGSRNTSITNNNISSTKNTGIYIMESDLTKAESNIVKDSGEYGFIVRQSTNTDVIKNDIDNSESYGIRINYGSDNTKVQSNKITTPKSECVYLIGSNDPNKDYEKFLELNDNTLDSPEGMAGVNVAKANVAAKIYSNYRTDGEKVFYNFKGDGESDYTKITEELSISDLTLQKCEGYNMISWDKSGENVSYRVYREDETGENMISDTPENFCLDNNLYKNPDDSEIVEKYDIKTYSVCPYRTFENVKYLGSSIFVDFNNAENESGNKLETEPETQPESKQETDANSVINTEAVTESPTEPATQSATQLVTEPSGV